MNISFRNIFKNNYTSFKDFCKMEPEYAVKISLTKHKHDNPQRPYCWSFVKFEEFIENGELYVLRFPSTILQYTTAASVLTAVAAIPGPTIAAGFTLPYWLRYGCVKLRLKNLMVTYFLTSR